MDDRGEPHLETQAAILSSLAQGIAPDPGRADNLGVDELLKVFKKFLADSPDVGRERLAEVVEKIPGRFGDLAAEALGKWGGSDAGLILTGIREDRLPRSRRKAIRRAIHFHESSHGALGAGRAERKATKTEEATEEAVVRTAMMSAPGPLGGRIWIYRCPPLAGKDGRMAVVVVSDVRGVRDFTWYDGSDAAFEKYCKAVAEKGSRLVPVPSEHLCSRLLQTEKKNLEAGEPMPSNYSVLRTWLNLDAHESSGLDHPAGAGKSILDVREPPTPREVQDLLTLEETHDWLLPPDAFEGKLEDIKDAERSKLVLEGMEPRQRIHKMLETILDRILEGETRTLWSTRLLDLAQILNQTGREKAGRTAALIASDLQSSSRSPISDAFLWTLGGRSLGILQEGGLQPGPAPAPTPAPEIKEPGTGTETGNNTRDIILP